MHESEFGYMTFTHIQRRRGRDGQSRQEYLQQLVEEYKKADTPDTKRKILATLGNFAYDPINYGWLYQEGVVELFIDALSNPGGDDELQRIGVFGLCNNALDRRVQQRLANDEVVIGLCKQIILANTKYTSEFLLSTVCLLWHICTPDNINSIVSSELKIALEGVRSSENVNVPLHNMCSIFLEDFFFDAQKLTSDEVLKESAEELSEESNEPMKEPLAKRQRSS
ncbi:hypothetical protein K450DRAFT_271661 [Umbelopsis ramanniana AG]|uniref:Armadillo repeat-containing protein 7 n=1 Tax=Umbelopsis ramanniana AG TaxID=1314678 RepID=A0AAD5HD61_UMBRA|nr:uncharacterized protein K450DRAFT_271661 [Umbelopsis ramanniana AG]KAI8579827.1 hypothetical protein K450DRAFT_271661 [Umbelopsis ramanniana AG]